MIGIVAALDRLAILILKEPVGVLLPDHAEITFLESDLIAARVLVTAFRVFDN